MSTIQSDTNRMDSYNDKYKLMVLLQLCNTVTENSQA